MANMREPGLIRNGEYGSNRPPTQRTISQVPMATYTIAEPSTVPGDPVGLSELIAPFWKRRRTIFALAIAGMILAVGWSSITPPTYRARTSVQIEGFNDERMMGEFTPISPALANATAESYLQNQVKLLESETLAKRVADQLNIQINNKPGLLSRIEQHIFFLRQPPATPDEQRMGMVKKAINVQTSLQSQVIELNFDARDPEFAARGANAAATQFIDLNREGRAQLVTDATEWLNKEAQQLRGKLEAENNQLEEYAHATGLIFAGKEDTVAEEKMRQIQEALSKAETDRATAQSHYEAAKQSGQPILSDVGTTSALKVYETDLQNMRRELSRMESLYTSAYPKVQQLEAQIAQTEKAVETERLNTLNGMRDQYQAATGLERLLSETHQQQLKTVQRQMDQERHYEVLKSEAEATQKLYESTLEKLKEAGAASSLRATNVKIIDPARVPRTPYSPSYPLNMAIGFALGTIGGIGLVAGQLRSQKVKRPGELTVLDVPELGVIPSAGGTRTLQLLRGKFKENELGLATWNQGTSPLSESYRSVLTSILFSPDLNSTPRGRISRAPGRALVITSLDPMAGKTTTLTNLGIASAERRQRVLLIDADLRRPRLHTLFKITNDTGLSDVLQKARSADFIHNSPLETLVRPTTIPNLWVMPSGPGNATISSLLHSSEFSLLLQRLRRDFDLIYIDTPPMMLYSDGRVLGRMSDGVVLVVRANTRNRDELRATYGRLLQDQIPVIGTVLNDWKMESNESHEYGRYYSRYYSPAANS